MRFWRQYRSLLIGVLLLAAMIVVGSLVDQPTSERQEAVSCADLKGEARIDCLEADYDVEGERLYED